MGFMDALAAAFENDDTLGEAGPAGLKKGARVKKITWLGPEPEGMAAMFEKRAEIEQEALPGQSLKDLGMQANIPIRYSCNRGTCGICDVKINGVETPACMAKMGKSDVTIEYQAPSVAAEYMKEKMAAEREAKKAQKAMYAKAGVVKAAPRPKKKPPANPLFSGMAPPPNPFADAGNLFAGVAKPTAAEEEEEEPAAPAAPAKPAAPANPFSGGMPSIGNPFAGVVKPTANNNNGAEEEEELSEAERVGAVMSRAEQMLKGQEAAKKNKGGWPFG